MYNNNTRKKSVKGNRYQGVAFNLNCVHVVQDREGHMCGAQRTTVWSWFSPRTSIQVPGWNSAHQAIARPFDPLSHLSGYMALELR